MGITRNFLNWYSRLSPRRGKAVPPYNHVVQIGDPVLRRTCESVTLSEINSVKIQTVLKKLEHVINKYGCVGMSAPQIGIDLRIFAIRFTAKQLSSLGSDYTKLRGISVVPFTVFINPTMKVIDYQKATHDECCESVRGFAAEVARYKKIEISSYDSSGIKCSQVLSDWSARIVQHEMDHLDGKLYTDIMDRSTLHCSCWQEVNLCEGKVVLPFTP